MNHAITLGGLLSVLAILAGLGVAAFGVLVIFAAARSDTSDDGTGSKGCFAFGLGAAFIVIGVWGLLS